jgi:hypothetical protein
MGNDHVTAVPAGLWEALHQVALADGYAVEVWPAGDTCEAFADYDAKRIVVSDRLDEATAVARLAHEIGHVRLHSSGHWLASQGTPGREVREVEAESVAFLVMTHHGVGMGTASLEYMADWLMALGPGNPADVIKAIGPRIVNTAEDLIRATSAHMETISAARPRPAARAFEPDFLSADLDGPALW